MMLFRGLPRSGMLREDPEKQIEEIHICERINL